MNRILSGISKSLYKTTKIALLCGVSLTCASAMITTQPDPTSVTAIDFLNPKMPLDKAEITRNKDAIKKMIMINREDVEAILDRSYTLRRLYNEAFREEFERIKVELAKAKSALSDKDEALAETQKTLDVNKDKLKMATKSSIGNRLMSAARKTKIVSLTEQLEKANVAVAGLTQEKAQLTSKIAGLEESLVKSNQALAVANQELEKKQAKIDTLKIVADGLVLKIKELQKGSEDDKAANAAEIQRLNAQLSQERQKLDDQTSALSTATAKTAQLQEQIAAKDKIIQDLGKIQAENETLKRALSAEQSRAQALQNEKTDLDRQLKDAQDALQSSEDALNSVKAQMVAAESAARDKLNMTVARYEAEKRKFAAEKIALDASISAKDTQIAEVNQALQIKTDEASKLTQKLSETSLKLESTEKLSKKLEDELKNTKEDLQYAQEDLSVANSKIKKSKDAEAERLAAEQRRRADEAAAEEEAERQRLAARPVRGERR